MRMTSGTLVNPLKANRYVPYNDDGDTMIYDNFSFDIFDDFKINLAYIGMYLVICHRCL